MSTYTFTKDNEFRDIKVRVYSEDEFRQLQFLLFKYGCFWASAGSAMKEQSVLLLTESHPDFVYVGSAGRMTYSSISDEKGLEYFKSNPNRELRLVATYSLEPPDVETVEIDGKRYDKDAVLEAIRDNGVEER